MGSKRVPGIPVSFMDRFKLQGEWWQKGNELLNLQNINACPTYYKGTVKHKDCDIGRWHKDFQHYENGGRN